jgi:RNA polymerase-binding transcription factor DksA
LITAARTEELDAMLARFEEQYEAHTVRLTQLISRRPDRLPPIHQLAEIAGCRQALAETARMLQRMADRDFGRCHRCADDIPIEWLRVRPDLSYCPGCQQQIPA